MDGQLIHTKGAKKMKREGQSLQLMVRENWTATCNRMKLEHSLTPHIKVNSKWIEDLIIRPESIQVLMKS